MSRGDAYAWMARFLGAPTEDAHVASLSYGECVKVPLAMEHLVRPPDAKPDLAGAGHWLMRANVNFKVGPAGHYVIKTGTEVVDYWPDRQTWKVCVELLAEEQEGLNELVMSAAGGSSRPSRGGQVRPIRRESLARV